MSAAGQPDTEQPDISPADTEHVHAEQAHTDQADVASRRARLVYVGAAAVLVAVLVLTWSLGGFKQQTRPLELVLPGSIVATGPYEFVFTKATAQHQPKTSYEPASWEVVLDGVGRTTGNETISPSTFGDDGMFVARDPQTSEVQNASGAEFGDTTADAFTPGLPPVPYQVEFTFSEAYRPGPTIRFIIIAQRFSDNSLIQTDDAEKSWGNDDHGYRLELPVAVLPEETS